MVFSKRLEWLVGRIYGAEECVMIESSGTGERRGTRQGATDNSCSSNGHLIYREVRGKVHQLFQGRPSSSLDLSQVFKGGFSQWKNG
jgi:hypothetical protein